MLKETKLALRITASAYDWEIANLVLAAVKDLSIAGVEAEGVSFSVTESQGTVTVTDTSTITDQALIRALITYVRANFGSPADYDRLKAAYDEQKAQLVTATGYGFPEEDD